MKKYLIGLAVLLLCIAVYITYDVIHVNSIRNELIANLDQSSVEFVKENKNALVRYPKINFKNRGLKDAYDDKFSGGVWSTVEILEKTQEYQLLFGELPMIESKGAGLPVNSYLYEYFSKELLGDEMIGAGLIGVEDIEAITDNAGFKSPYDIFKDYYGLILSLFLDGKIGNEEVFEFHGKSEAFTMLLETRPSDVFMDSIPGLISQYTSYSSLELIRENIQSLMIDANRDSDKEVFYYAIKSISDLMDAPLAPGYTIENLLFTADPNANAFIIPSEIVTLIRSHGFSQETATYEFAEYLNKDSRVFNKTLESNEVYYIVSTNDFLVINQIEIVYTFDNDYSKFLYGNDSKEVLEKRINELGYGTGYLNEYDITYLYNISDEKLKEYGEVIDEVLDNYDEILMPIMISNEVNHFFRIENGRYFTKLELMFDPLVDTRDMLSDITFYVVEKITSDYMNIAGLAMSEGILITKDNLNLRKTARNTIHHEIMHQIDRYYRTRYNIRIFLDHSDFKYLDKRDLRTKEYIETYRSENFSRKNVLSRMDIGMTSHYAGINKREHLAELWADLLTDYDFYKDEIQEHPIFDKNVDKLVIFINEIIETVDGETIEDVEDMLRYDGVVME